MPDKIKAVELTEEELEDLMYLVKDNLCSVTRKSKCEEYETCEECFVNNQLYNKLKGAQAK